MATKDPSGSFTRLSVEEAKQKIESGPAQIIDVRPPADFAGGHVPGALSLPALSIRIRKEELTVEEPMIVIDGEGERGAAACAAAAELGFSDVYLVEGGTTAWRRAGYELHALGD
jgi:rhodanese-related sulfurtransferase